MNEDQTMPEIVPIFSKQEIADRVKALAQQISADYADKELIIIGVLKGCFIFLSDLVRQLNISVKIDFIRLASYGSGTVSSGAIKITKDIELDLQGKDVLIVEDIIDSGKTLSFLLDHLKSFGPKSVKICSFIDKTERREISIPIDYKGFKVKAGFLVGYGLDFDERYRTMPEVCCIKP